MLNGMINSVSPLRHRGKQPSMVRVACAAIPGRPFATARLATGNPYARRLTQTELARAKALRQSILKDAFAGKLVPQDPNDEPASELLARIRAQRNKP